MLAMLWPAERVEGFPAGEGRECRGHTGRTKRVKLESGGPAASPERTGFTEARHPRWNNTEGRSPCRPHRTSTSPPCHYVKARVYFETRRLLVTFPPNHPSIGRWGRTTTRGGFRSLHPLAEVLRIYSLVAVWCGQAAPPSTRPGRRILGGWRARRLALLPACTTATNNPQDRVDKGD